MAIKTIYKTECGKTFDTLKQAEDYEKDRGKEIKELFCKFFQTQQGQEIFKTYGVEAFGTWKVIGRKFNGCDRINEIDMGYFEGTLHQVVYHAVAQKEFYDFHTFGDIKHIRPKKLS